LRAAVLRVYTNVDTGGELESCCLRLQPGFKGSES
jgi:hypothetical protein